MAASHLDIVKALRLSPEGLGTERVLNFERFGLTDTAAITRLIEPTVKELGFDLVRVAMIGGTSDPTLQVMAERPDTRQLTIDDCSDLSRKLSELLDAEEAAGRDPIEGSYRLEVSSPGIDRPLTRLKDYADWAGHEARIKYANPVDGAKQVSGIIEGIAGDTISVATPKGERQIDFANIASAKLLLTDKLINATAPISSEGADIIKTEG
jgi:ribosome maturation factor RimP